MSEKGARERGYWTLTELAELGGLSTARLRQLLVEGKELQGNKAGQTWTVRYAEGVRWLETRQRK